MESGPPGSGSFDEDGPGGFGTLDELFEALTLIQTATIRHFPVVLVGAQEWDGLLDWLGARALADHRIDAGDLRELRVVSAPREVARIVTEARERQRAHRRARSERGGP